MMQPDSTFAAQVLSEEGTVEQLAHRIVHEYGPRWYNAYMRQYPNSAAGVTVQREAMAHYCVSAVIEAARSTARANDPAWTKLVHRYGDSTAGEAEKPESAPRPPEAPTESNMDEAARFRAKYPMHAKLEPVAPLSQAIYDFLEWCGERNIVLAQQMPDDSEVFYPILVARRDLLAEHFEIDQQVLEAEKRQMLEAFTASTTGQLPGGVHEASCQQGSPCPDPEQCPDPVGCDVQELLPKWAIGRATSGYMQMNAALPTRDGRRVGNSVVVHIQDTEAGKLATVVTDAGNTMRLNERELEELFHPPEYITRGSPALGR